MLPLNVSHWNVLLVDDEPDNLSVLELLLTFYDAHVTSVRSGQEALKLLNEQSFTLTLVDIQMPIISGWDIIKAIRTHDNPKIRTMLAIAVTAYAMTGDRERVLDAGFDGYIPKPIDVTTFMQTLHDTVQARLAHDAQEPTPSITIDEPVQVTHVSEPDPSLVLQDPSIAGEKHER